MKKTYMISAVISLIVVLLVASSIFINGCASKTVKVYHVGILSGLDAFAGTADSFKQEMTNLGYIEGKNIVYDYQKTNFEPEKDQKILKKFVDDKDDLIFGFNTEVALEAKEATKGTGIPIVFANAFLEGNNLVESVQVPGGNVTGVRYPNIDIAIKRLEILHELAPQAKRIWIPYQAGYPTAPSILAILRPAAVSLNLTLIEFSSNNLTELQAELERRSQSGDIGFDAVLYIPESLSTTKAAFEIITNFTRDKKIPVGGSAIVTKDYGTVFSVTVDNNKVGKQAAHLADKILKGADAGTIPVVSPESRIIINYKVAQNLGLNVSEGMLAQADEIIR